MNAYNYLLNQLNLLIGFLDVSDKEVYEQIKNHDQYNLGRTIEQLYDNNYENYSNHIASSALLLGFAHFEDFLGKCIVKLLIKYPEKNPWRVDYKTMQENSEKLVEHLAEGRSQELNFPEKIQFLKKNLNIKDETTPTQVNFVNGLRNCIMHKNGFADKRLLPEFTVGQKIILTSGQVHGYGILVRQFADIIWKAMPRD